MLCFLKSVIKNSFFLTPFFLLITYSSLTAEQGAWGGNGGWWGGGNREWIGDFDGPGYHRSTCNTCHSRYCPRYYHNGHYHYPHPYVNSCDNPCTTQYYYDDSVPGAGVYFDLERCRS